MQAIRCQIVCLHDGVEFIDARLLAMPAIGEPMTVVFDDGHRYARTEPVQRLCASGGSLLVYTERASYLVTL